MLIRKLARIDAPVDEVLKVLRDTDAWPQWMPGVISTRTLDRGAGHRQIEASLQVMGRRQVQHLECREQDGRLIQRQVIGWFREWQATWTFRSPPKGRGTIVSLALELDFGIAGLWLPRRLLSGWVKDRIDGTVDRLRERVQQFAPRPETTPTVEAGQPVLQVYETADGFEVHFAGRVFQIEATDAPR